MSINIENLNQFNLAKYNQMVAELKKEQIKKIEQNKKNKKNTNENKKSFGTMNFISLNSKDVNMANLQEVAKLISQAKASKLNNTKSTKDTNKTNTNKQENKKDDNKIDAKEKSTLKTGAGIIGKEALYRLTSNTIFKGNPEAIIASLVGVDPEEDGDAFKKGAVTGKGGDFSGDYKKFFNGFMERASKSNGNAFLEGLNLIPNVVSIGLTNCLKYAGNACSKVFGKDLTALVGSGISAVGKGINAIGDAIGSNLKGAFNFTKNLFTGNFRGIGESCYTYFKDLKNIAVSVKDKVVEVAKDAGNLIVNTAKKIGNGIKTGFNKVKNFFKKLF